MKSEEGIIQESDPLKRMNPDHILYCVCIITKDYLETVLKN